MTVDITPIIDAARSIAMASGYFERTTAHEPKNAPGLGITWALWVDQIDPLPAQSDVTATAIRLAFIVRLYSSMMQEPQDGIDPDLTAAATSLMAGYSAAFTLGGTVKHIDLLGEAGVALSLRAGYLNQDGRLFRIYDLTVPVVIDAAFVQAP